MIRNHMIFIVMAIMLSMLLSGCSPELEAKISSDIPEAESIQKLLDDMSLAIMEGNQEKAAQSFSEYCPGKQQELDSLKLLMENAELKDYSQVVVKSKRLRDGVTCTVSISIEGDSGGKSIDSRIIRNIYFVLENGEWKIGDFNFYPYMNPTVIVGSDSPLYDAASVLSDALESELISDTEHLQSYGDVIMVGAPYDNASILELEEKGAVFVKVTEEYPGGNTGIVQVLSNVGNYRHVVVIQGSSVKAAEQSIRFMAEYIKDNPYMNPGVYFIDEEGLRKASPLELSTLVTLDASKSSQRMKEVQKHMEANLEIIEEELQYEKEQLLREQSYMDKKYREDFSKAFSRYDFYPEKSVFDSMVLINANYTDSRLCKAVFELPIGNSIGTAYAYADYASRRLKLSEKAQDDRGLLLGGSASHTLTAHEIDGSGNELEISAYGVSLLRLAGFSSSEVYNITASRGNAVFLNIGGGYALKPGSPIVSSSELQLPLGGLKGIYNDMYYLDLDKGSTNIAADEIKAIFGRTNEVLRQSDKVPRAVSEPEGNLDMPYNTAEIFSLLRSTFVIDDSPGRYSTLEEARDQLRSAMGSLLAVKCTRHLVSTASRYPASQLSYARYAAGIINLEHPGAYAEAAENSRLVLGLREGLPNLLSDSSEKINKITDILADIVDDERSPEMFYFPDYCIANSKGSHWDKALLAYGLYSNLAVSRQETYIALGENSSYLVFTEKDQLKYLDCRYNTVKDFVTDDIYAVFNKSFVYNKKLGIGEAPEFLR